MTTILAVDIAYAVNELAISRIRWREVLTEYTYNIDYTIPVQSDEVTPRSPAVMPDLKNAEG
jgi:hypothetical protein